MAGGRLFVISAPSGAGKSTLIKRLRTRFPDMIYSVSWTTRPPRKGEIPGVHYHFRDRAQFEANVRAGGFLEWKEVHGNLYGTPVRPVEEALEAGRSMILDIDVQGAAEVFRRFPDAVGIFVTVPSMDELERRLCARGSDDEETIRLRLRNASEEMELADSFDYRVVNDRLQRAEDEIASIIERETSGMDA